MVSGSLDLDGWNTSNILDMSSMFSYASIGSIINFETWDTSNVTNMSSMFYGVSTSNLDLRNWNVCKVTSYEDFSSASSGIIGVPYFGDSSRCDG